MTTLFGHQQRILSGMRPVGRLHLGHYHGVIKNWVELQHSYDCYFFCADWHALTTHYEDPRSIAQASWDMVVDWLACGVSPGSASIFVQSRVPEHAELHLLLSMLTPLSWLERVPAYNDQKEKLKEKGLSTYGFLGYPLLQSADVLAYKACGVPVGEDQVAHIELAREIARRFNHLYGREPDFEQRVTQAIAKMGKKNAKIYKKHRNSFLEQGDEDALETAKALLDSQQNLSIADRERLQGYLEGSGKIILPEPQALLTTAAKMPGLDGRRMSSSYNNTIGLRDDPEVIEKKIRTMQTDPARVRRNDPGDPANCPVWAFHEVYSDDDTQSWVKQGCKSAGIGCVDCKGPIIDAVLNEIRPIGERATEYAKDPATIRSIIDEGSEAARDIARDTLDDVRKAMGLAY